MRVDATHEVTTRSLASVSVDVPRYTPPHAEFVTCGANVTLFCTSLPSFRLVEAMAETACSPHVTSRVTRSHPFRNARGARVLEHSGDGPRTGNPSVAGCADYAAGRTRSLVVLLAVADGSGVSVPPCQDRVRRRFARCGTRGERGLNALCCTGSVATWCRTHRNQGSDSHRSNWGWLGRGQYEGDPAPRRGGGIIDHVSARASAALALSREPNGEGHCYPNRSPARGSVSPLIIISHKWPCAACDGGVARPANPGPKGPGFFTGIAASLRPTPYCLTCQIMTGNSLPGHTATEVALGGAAASRTSAPLARSTRRILA